MSDLSKDLVVEIVNRLPAASLKRLRTTCKLWNRLFSDSEFAIKHVDKALKQFDLVLMSTTKGFKICSVSVNLQGVPSLEEKGREVSIIQSSSGQESSVSDVFHCQGLLLCTIKDQINNKSHVRLVVWNPCTGQTKWIQPRYGSEKDSHYTYVFGSYCESGASGYKLLSYSHIGHSDELKFAIFDFNSTSWRDLDVIQDFVLMYARSCVSLKGKTYWFAWNKTKQEHFLVSFDYTRESFTRLPLPSECPPCFNLNMVLSVFREEKLSMLFQHEVTSRKEVWVANSIGGDDETKAVSWSKFLVIDLGVKGNIRTSSVVFFKVEEENRVVICCDDKNEFHPTMKELVYVVGDDIKTSDVDFGASRYRLCWPPLLHYVPSLVQIIPQGRGKRKLDATEQEATNKRGD